MVRWTDSWVHIYEQVVLVSVVKYERKKWLTTPKFGGEEQTRDGVVCVLFECE